MEVENEEMQILPAISSGTEKNGVKPSNKVCKINIGTFQGSGSDQLSKSIPKEEKSLTCLDCGKTFLSSSGINKHRNTKPTCRYCDYRPKSCVILYNHLDEQHAEHKNIICLKCNKMFFTLQNLRSHMLTHTSQFEIVEATRKCLECGKIVPSSSALSQHKKTYHGVSKPCLYCDYIPKNNISLVKHMEEQHQEHKSNVCLKCNKRFFTSESFQLHMISHSKTMSCPDCGKNFLTKCGLSRHLNNHQRKSKSCQYCKYVSEDRISLQEHMEEKHSNHKKLVCKKCGKRFFLTTSLRTHLRNHNEEFENIEGDIKLSCYECGKVFFSRTCLTKHVQSNHLLKQETKRCKYCEYCAENPVKLHKHMEQKHEEHKNFICSNCGKKFFHRRNLRLHMVVHSGVKSHTCEICGLSFTLRGNLMSHKRLHTGIRPYICSVCGKSFPLANTLRLHEVVHTNKREFACNICGATFSRRGALRNHKARHLEKRPHKCTMCEKSFVFRSERNSHMTVHTGIKQYKCDICEKRFSRNYGLKVHMNIHSGETPHICYICGKGFIQQHCLKLHMKHHKNV